MTKNFYKRFGIKIGNATAKEKFVSRVDSAIFGRIEDMRLWNVDFLLWLNEKLGENWHGYIGKHYSGNRYISPNLTISSICRKDFTRCILILQLMYEYLQDSSIYGNETSIKYLDEKISGFIDKSETDLGVFWKKGKFYPSGAKFLDKALVEDILDWLNNHPKEKKDFEKALKALMEKRYDDVLSNCYNCVEGMAKAVLNNNKGLIGNKKELLVKLGLSKEWGSFLANFMSYANEYKRHASKKRHQENPNEVEAFLYLTGLIIRLCIKNI